MADDSSAPIPNPGSDEAIALGCTCPVIDNHRGKGIKIDGQDEPMFWQSEGCILHGNIVPRRLD